MILGPYHTENNALRYCGNKQFPPLPEVRNVRPPDFKERHLAIRRQPDLWGALLRLWHAVFTATNYFMEKEGVILVDLPITTRMISSPGALTKTIPSDVDPFAISFFEHTTFLSQSSQLYLEFAVMHPDVQRVYCWEKSFRRECSDFRHLPEFTHIECEATWNFETNLRFQEAYLTALITYLVSRCPHDLAVFLTPDEITALQALTHHIAFKRITFHDAFEILHRATGSPTYTKPTISHFGAYEEVLLTELLGGPVFVTHFLQDEVAFYHASAPHRPTLAMNADLLWPGYGELIGSGERVHTRAEIEAKICYFKLNFEDYESYIQSRDDTHPVRHSGWGMGIERFLHAILKLPFIWDTKPFPRVDNQCYP